MGIHIKYLSKIALLSVFWRWLPLGWFQWWVVPSTRRSVSIVAWLVPPATVDVAVRMASSVTDHPKWFVPTALEPTRSVLTGLPTVDDARDR
jgi:hypothetical protein